MDRLARARAIAATIPACAVTEKPSRGTPEPLAVVAASRLAERAARLRGEAAPAPDLTFGRARNLGAQEIRVSAADFDAMDDDSIRAYLRRAWSV